MKKLIAAILTVMLALTPVGSFVFQDHATTADAKSYKSGKKSFNTNQNQTNNNSLFQNKDTKKSDATTNNKTTATNKGSLMKRYY